MTTNINNVMPADVPMWTEAESNTLNQCGTYAIALQRLVRELEEQGTISESQITTDFKWRRSTQKKTTTARSRIGRLFAKSSG